MPVVKQAHPLHLRGLQCRTRNADELAGKGQIGALVGKFYTEDIANEKTTSRVNPGVVYCVYTDYASDETGDYTFFIGEEIAAASVPTNFIAADSVGEHQGKGEVEKKDVGRRVNTVQEEMNKDGTTSAGKKNVIAYVTVEAGLYEKRVSEKGKLPDCEVALWKQIWGDAELKARRAFGTDFVVYDKLNPAEDTEIPIFLQLAAE
ncbi:unnamed protein product [Amoebophrya sp. A120]|nr:unnamed protein product [Amoebophrya sp. A120]|eukprot:GSA120T00000895001.1